MSVRTTDKILRIWMGNIETLEDWKLYIENKIIISSYCIFFGILFQFKDWLPPQSRNQNYHRGCCCGFPAPQLPPRPPPRPRCKFCPNCSPLVSPQWPTPPPQFLVDITRRIYKTNFYPSRAEIKSAIHLPRSRWGDQGSLSLNISRHYLIVTQFPQF